MKTATFDRLSFVLALSCLVLFVFLPLGVIYLFQAGGVDVAARQSGEVAVGIAVVLRATARRWLRAGSSNLLRTTLGTYSRTSARTLTRRVVKSAGRVVLGLLVKGRGEGEHLDADAPAVGIWLSWIGLLVGFAALCLSFWGVLALQSHDEVAKLTQSGEVSIGMATLLSGGPLLVYAAAIFLAGRVWGVEVHFRTALDGLLLQAYFTGAGSFLPMTTDAEYVGRDEAKHRVAAVALGTLYVFHLGLSAAAHWTGSYVLLFAGSMFLTYCFVFSFPVRPLEGHYLWARSRLLWLCFWLPILASFIGSLPDSFAAIL